MLLARGDYGGDYAHLSTQFQVSFKSVSNDLCHVLPMTAQRRCTKFVDPSPIAPFLAIGISDAARRIIAKAILTITGIVTQEAVGPSQVCAGQICGNEAAVHTVESLIQQEETDHFAGGC